MAAHLGTSASAVARIWRAHELRPHLVEPFKLSNDTHFIEKLEDIVGLYLDPPEHALVLCYGEKTQIQALDRTQPGLPPKRGPSEIHADLTEMRMQIFRGKIYRQIYRQIFARHRHLGHERKRTISIDINRLDSKTCVVYDVSTSSSRLCMSLTLKRKFFRPRTTHSHSIVNETLIKLILLVILFEKLYDTIVYTMFKNTTLLWIFKAQITNIEVILNLDGRS